METPLWSGPKGEQDLCSLDPDLNGSARVFTLDSCGTWTQQARLMAADRIKCNWGDSEEFGTSVAISGDTAVIGAFEWGGYLREETLWNIGAAYVFTRDTNGTWTQQAKLHASDPYYNSRFGWSVAVSGDTALIGADRDTYVFTRDTNDAWTQQAKLGVGVGWRGFPMMEAVALSGDTALIGNLYSAYVFTRDTNGTWTQQARLLPADGGEPDRWFGSSVPLSGDTALIGASADDDKGTNAGSAYVFTRDTNGTWTQQAKLLATDGASSDYFGRSAALKGDTAVIGAKGDDGRSGSAYVFTRDTNGTWTQQRKLVATDRASWDFFGNSIALSDNSVLVGANWDDDKGDYSGSAYVFSVPSPDSDCDGDGVA